jgi:hypothetical protein
MLSKHDLMLRMLIAGSKMLFTFKRKDHNIGVTAPSTHAETFVCLDIKYIRNPLLIMRVTL